MRSLLGLIPGVGEIGVDHQIHIQFHIIAKGSLHAGDHNLLRILCVLPWPLQDHLVVHLPQGSNTALGADCTI